MRAAPLADEHTSVADDDHADADAGMRVRVGPRSAGFVHRTEDTLVLVDYDDDTS